MPSPVQGVRQLPLLQVCEALHAAPHAPQLAVLVLVSTHAPAHGCCPVGHVHTPLEHDAPVAQAWPHDPQFAASDEVSTHASPHRRFPAWGQAQDPPEQICAAGQAVPHEPQFDVSVLTFTQAPLHSTVPGAQAQCPAVHSEPVTGQLASVRHSTHEFDESQ